MRDVATFVCVCMPFGLTTLLVVFTPVVRAGVLCLSFVLVAVLQSVPYLLTCFIVR